MMVQAELAFLLKERINRYVISHVETVVLIERK